jgi:hypothetical protein
LIHNQNPRDKDELYDLQSDRLEMKNLALDKGNGSLLGQLKREMLAEMKRLEDPAARAVEAAL